MTARPIRTAFLTPSLHPGGAERQMLLLAARLPRPDFDVRFLLLWERGAWAVEADRIGVRVDMLGLRREACVPFGPACAMAVARAVRRYVRLARRLDLVDAWLVPSYTFAGLAQPLARVPVLVAGRRSMADVYASMPRPRRAAAALATRRMAAVVANSQAAAIEAIARERLDPERVHVIPNAVEPLSPDPGARVEQRRRWGVGDGHVVVGCVANYKPGKGLETLVEVATRLRLDASELRYVLVGEGPLRPVLAEAIRARGLEETVTLHGPASDARRLYPAFDIAVHPSASEGLSNVILEALSAGLPVVAGDVGGTREAIAPDVGILVAAPTADLLAPAILGLARDGERRRRLAVAARARAADFSPSRLVATTADLYERLVRERGGRARSSTSSA